MTPLAAALLLACLSASVDAGTTTTVYKCPAPVVEIAPKPMRVQRHFAENAKRVRHSRRHAICAGARWHSKHGRRHYRCPRRIP